MFLITSEMKKAYFLAWSERLARHGLWMRLINFLMIAGVAFFLVGMPGPANAACLRGDGVSTNNGTGGNDTILCDPTNDPGGASISTHTGRDTIVVQGGVTTGSIRTFTRFEKHVDRVTITDSRVNGGISTNEGNDVITVTNGTVTGAIASGRFRDTIVITAGSVVGRIAGRDGGGTITIRDSDILGSIVSGGGRDSINITRSTVGGNLVTGSGAGSDSTTLDAATIVGDVWMASNANGGGVRQGDRFTMNNGSIVQGDVVGSDGGQNGSISDHRDILNLNSGTILGEVRTYRARDTINLNGTIVGGRVDAGIHNDTINLRAGSVGGDILAGNDNDGFTWSGGTLAGSFLGGSGNDTAVISLTTGDVDVIVNGESGSDTFQVLNATTTVNAATIRGFESARSDSSVVDFDTLMLNGVDDPTGDNNAATDLRVTRGNVTLRGASVLTNLLGSRNAEILTITDTTVVSGSIQGAGGADTISVLGDASVTGDVFGGGGGHDGSVGADSGDTITINTSGSVENVIGGSGSDTFIWASGAITSFDGGDGSDVAIVSAAEYDQTQVLDGGDDASSADGFIDRLTLNGVTGTINAGNILNWEVVGFGDGITVEITDLIAERVNASCGGSTTVGGASMVDDVDGCIDDDEIIITGDTVIANNIEGAGGSDTITISGNASVGGTVRGDGAGQDMSGGSDSGDLITIDTTGTVNLIDTGAGADTVNLLAGTVTTDVLTGIGDDAITLNGAVVAGNIDGGDGDDDVDLLSGSVNIVTAGLGEDTITLDGATITVDLRGGGGSDLITVVSGSVGANINLGNGGNSTSDSDTFVLTGGSVGGSVFGDNGQDTITLTGGTVGGDVHTNPGNDIITLNGTILSGEIDSGRGNDDITLLSGSANDILGGDDDDTIILDGATITADLRGGEGTDTITVISGTVGGDIHLGRDNNSTTDGDTLLLMTGGDVAGNIFGDRGNDTITLSGGTVALEVRGNLGNDTITLDGGAVTGEISGGDGDDAFTWSSGTLSSFNGGDGSDIATVTATEYDGTQLLDGGDDADVADGFIDELTLDGISGTFNGGNIVNWEIVHLMNVTTDITDLVTPVVSICGGSVMLGGASMVDDVDGCIQDDAIEITGTTMISNDIDGAGGSDTIIVSGDASVTGAVRGDGEGQDSSAIFDDADTITISTTGNVGSVHGGVGGDTLDLLSGVIGSATGDSGADTITLDGAVVTGDIDAGGDADTVDLLSGSVTNVNTGSGVDTVTLNGAMVTGDIDTGDNNDTINLLSGTVNNVDAGSNADRITLDGAIVSGTVFGGDGDDRFIWSSGDMVGFNGGDGSDIAIVTAAEYDLSQILDGGDDSSVADGFIDELTLDGVSGDLTGGNIINWEIVHLMSVTTDIMDLVAPLVNTCGGSVTLGGASIVDDVDGCFQADTIEVIGTTVIANDIDGAGGSDTITVSGDASVTGAVRGDGDGQDASAALDAADIITINTTGNVGSVHGGQSDDTLNLLAGTIGSASGDVGEDVITLNGATVTGDIDAGAGVDLVDLLSGSVSNVNGGTGDDTITLAGATVSADIGGDAGEDFITVSSGSVGGDIHLGIASNTSTEDDRFSMTGGTITGSVDGDRGNDRITLRGGNLGLDVNANWGEDIIALSGAVVAGNINGGRDADLIALVSGSVTDVSAGEDADTIRLEGATVTGDLRGDEGVDLITVTSGTVAGNIHLGRDDNASTDDDTLLMTGGSVMGNVFGDLGDDTITLSGGTVMLDVSSNSGDDTVTLDGATVTGDIDAGDDTDTVELLSGSANNVFGGTGDDTVTLDGATVTGDIDAGDDTDTVELLSGSANNVFGGTGDDIITLAGATIMTNISGGDGDDSFDWSSGAMVGFDGGNGSDIATVTAVGYDGSQVLDGGDDTSAGDGFIDALTFQGLSITTNGANIVNWETVTVQNGTIDFGPTLAVGSGVGLGLTADSGGVIQSMSDFDLMGDLVTLAGGAFLNTGAGVSLVNILGNIRNAGSISVQDGGTGDIISVSGNYSGPGALQLDVDFGNASADTLVIAGSVVTPGSTIFVTDVSSAEANGEDILLVDVVGSTRDGDFQLAGEVITIGQFSYELNLVNAQWFLQLIQLLPQNLLPQNLIYEAYPRNLMALNSLASHRQRIQDRAWLASGDEYDDTTGFWMRLTSGERDLDPRFSTTKHDSGTAKVDYDITTTKLEVGADGLLDNVLGGRLVGGVRLFTGTASLSGDSALVDGDIDTDATGAGVSLTWYDKSDAYIDTQLQYTVFDSDLATSTTNLENGNDGRGYAASIEVGKKIWLSESSAITPEAQYIYSDVDFDTFTASSGEEVSLKDGSASELRLGASYDHVVGKNLAKGTGAAKNNRFFVKANVFHQFDTTTQVSSGGSTLINKVRPWRGEVGIGSSREWFASNGNSVAIFGELTVGTDLGSGLSSGGQVSGQIGFKIGF